MNTGTNRAEECRGVEKSYNVTPETSNSFPYHVAYQGNTSYYYAATLESNDKMPVSVQAAGFNGVVTQVHQPQNPSVAVEDRHAGR